jgi:hypothetical protein
MHEPSELTQLSTLDTRFRSAAASLHRYSGCYVVDFPANFAL